MFRLLKAALDDKRGVPWLLLENVEGLLDRIEDRPPVIEYVVRQLEEMGYSWAHRIVDTAGATLAALLRFVAVFNHLTRQSLCAGFGLPHRRKRVLLVASLSGDPRDVLLTQVRAVIRSLQVLCKFQTILVQPHLRWSAGSRVLPWCLSPHIQWRELLPLSSKQGGRGRRCPT